MQLYAIFHLNLFYSSIEEEQRRAVLQRCYWPLLRLAEQLHLPLGIEASGHTLEIANDLDPEWVQTLRRLVGEGPCEWLGSGYTQLIGPLVPALVNAKNLHLGHEVYERLLGIRPRVAFVNEQAYSAGLIEHYVEAGYQAMVMEWENPAHVHPEWDPNWQYLPQRACGPDGRSLPIIWNKSIAFQKFQRYAHGEMTFTQYRDYVAAHDTSHPRAFSVYGNDAEIFDFRPGRYEAEAPLQGESEWNRIQQVFERFQADPRFTWVSPSQVLALQTEVGAGHHLRLESTSNPVPVKKQAKYNVLRWSVTGRDDSRINSLCWKLYERLRELNSEKSEDWREVCWLWSSDFRTHITDRRWADLQNRLAVLAYPSSDSRVTFVDDSGSFCERRLRSTMWVTHRDGALLSVESHTIKAQINCAKGLAIHGLWVKALSECPILGTLPHGFFQDITMGADYYSGHLVFESPVQAKITDLSAVEPEISFLDEGESIKISAIISTKLGTIRKDLLFTNDGRLHLQYHLDWKNVPAGVLRLGHLTLHPSAFQFEDLVLETHNGGSSVETFPLHGSSVDHSRPVSFLVSANNGFGYSEGRLALKDRHLQVCVENSQASGYVIPLLSVQPIAPSYFCRVSFSAMEFDDTTRGGGYPQFQRFYEFQISPHVRQASAVLTKGENFSQKEIVC